MVWSVIGFSKNHSEKTLPQIMFSDPDWFFWSMSNVDWSKKSRKLQEEIELINHRCRNIKIPNNADRSLEIEYLIHPPTKKFGGFSVVPKERPIHRGSSPAYRNSKLDLSFPKQFASYDKSGYKHFLDNFKFYIGGNSKLRFTKEYCENFYSNPDNFEV